MLDLSKGCKMVNEYGKIRTRKKRTFGFGVE